MILFDISKNLSMKPWALLVGGEKKGDLKKKKWRNFLFPSFTYLSLFLDFYSFHQPDTTHQYHHHQTHHQQNQVLMPMQQQSHYNNNATANTTSVKSESSPQR